MGRTRQMKGAHLEHRALMYSSTEDFLEYMVPYVRAGLDTEEVVFVAARRDNLAALRSEVGRRGAGAGWADTEAWHKASCIPRAGHRCVGRGSPGDPAGRRAGMASRTP